MQNAAKAYLKTQVNTVSPGKLLILLYEAAIKFLNQSKEKMAEKDYAAKGILISKAIDVISELDESLNAQKGGQIAENLHGLYFYCNTRLLQANMSMDPKIIDEVLNILESIKSAFLEISSQQPGMEATMKGLEKAAAGAAAEMKQPGNAESKPSGPVQNETEPASKQEDAGNSPEPPAPKPRTLPGAYGRIGGYK
jgi:flagellar protein FliS